MGFDKSRANIELCVVATRLTGQSVGRRGIQSQSINPSLADTILISPAQEDSKRTRVVVWVVVVVVVGDIHR